MCVHEIWACTRMHTGVHTDVYTYTIMVTRIRSSLKTCPWMVPLAGVTSTQRNTAQLGYMLQAWIPS